MSEQDAVVLAERIKSDEALRDRLAAASDQAAWQTIAREAGFDVGPADLPAMKTALGLEELSDEDLESIAGHVGGGTGTDPRHDTTPAIVAAAIPHG